MTQPSRVKESEKAIVNIDMLDRKILRALFSYSRQSNKEIAKIVRSSKEVVNYRIKSMQKRGILNGRITIIDSMKLGYNVNITYMKLQKINHAREIEIIKFFQEHDFIKVVATCTGQWDLFIVFCSKDTMHLNQLLIEFDNAIADNLKLRKYATIIHEEFLAYDYIFKLKDNAILKKDRKTVDDNDIKILNMISRNADATLVEIARHLELTPEAVSYRIKKLIQSRVIKYFFPLVNISLLGFHWYTISIKLHNVTPKREKELIKYIISHPNIVVVIRTVGSWDIEFDLHIESSYMLRKLLMEIRELFQDIINDIESNLIFHDYKYTHLPKGVVDNLEKRNE